MLLLAEQNRAFGYAIAASLALHALILALRVPALRPAEPAPAEPPLVAHLVEPPPPAPPAPVVQTPPAPKPVAKPKAKPKPKPLARPAPRPVAPRQEPAAEQNAEQEAEPVIAPPAPAPSPAPPVVAVAPRAAPAPAPDSAAILAGFRRQLLAVAVRYKRYPRIALDNAWTGDVTVRMEVGANGAVSSIKVKTSSGYEVLDEQALEMFRKAAAEVPVPAALRGKAFPVEVRAIYNLRDRPG